MKKISIVLVLLWMSTIFYFSNQPATISTTQSDRVINTINIMVKDNRVMKDIVNKLYDSKGASFIIRKSAHMISYGLLASLLFIAIYSHRKYISASFKYAFAISLLYAVSDEIHQYFVPGRACMLQDVLIDCIGMLIGLTLISILYKFTMNKV
ncbi:VanZ family protein [Romboutsia sedimentorum]|uniref:VanZ family protein n=1 Tax=Romboutsia sedimentorum TaxID=1368474 RepID=A0ABT7E4W1_9FIRM|nr:VanZ family protein [Romboutsia sedimentorum]MDK2561964.1 VanZ family protein [Romboutsia sedimentorum]MDK2586758.1 VanZ family protein [Romboutsia sedimentorum]